MREKKHGCVIVGNDTEIGKTTIACQLIRALLSLELHVGAYKPAASGCTGGSADDAVRLAESLSNKYPVERVCPYRFTKPVAPVLAAESEGLRIDEGKIQSGLDWWHSQSDYVVVETAGGVMSPLTRSTSNLDFAEVTKLPALVVVGNRLGAINQAMLVCSVLRLRGIEIVAVVFNEASRLEFASDELLESNVLLFRQLYPQYLQSEAPETLDLRFDQALPAAFAKTLIPRQK